jgi:hypothetical protein
MLEHFGLRLSGFFSVQLPMYSASLRCIIALHIPDVKHYSEGAWNKLSYQLIGFLFVEP